MKRTLVLLALFAVVGAMAETAVLSADYGVTSFSAEGVTGYAPGGAAVTGVFDDYKFQGSGESSYGITVSGGNHNIAVKDLNIVSSNSFTFEINAGSVTLDLAGSNAFVSGASCGILVDSSAALTITGEGSLTAIATAEFEDGKSNGCAGLGGYAGENSGAITIDSGTLYVRGAVYASGIGGGAHAIGNVTINGGSVFSFGGNYGAGIGGGTGWEGTAGKITINGGYVYAEANNGAGIGCGDEGGHNEYPAGEVTINGGTVEAFSIGGAGIGAGSGPDDSGRGPKIAITGGSIYAYSSQGEEIGPGRSHSQCPDLVNAKGEKVYKVTIYGAQPEDGSFFSCTVTREGDESFSYVYEGYGHSMGPDLYFHLPNGEYTVACGEEEYVGTVDGADTYFVKKATGSIDLSVEFGDTVFTSRGVDGYTTGGSHIMGLYEEYILNGHTEEYTIKVTSGLHQITITNVLVATTNSCAFDIESSIVTLSIAGSNAFVSGGGCGIHVAKNSALTIIGIGEGSVTAIATGEDGASGLACAGLGGGNNEANGPIVIESGSVMAQGAAYAAGIGGGAQAPADVTIKSGEVYAIGGVFGAGIGGGTGWGGYAGTINIEGGYVAAYAVNGAGIGCGDEGGHNVYPAGTVNITGGTITVESNEGAGIGAGSGPEDSGRGPNIYLSNCSVYALSSVGMPIGPGRAMSECPAPLDKEGGQEVYGAVLPEILPDQETYRTIYGVKLGDVSFEYSYYGRGHFIEEDLFFPLGSLQFYLPNGSYVVQGDDTLPYGGTVKDEDTVFEVVPEPAAAALALLALLAFLRRK
jgi:hypothetical protein